MLRIHTGFRKLSKTNVYDFNLKKMNLFDNGVPGIKIARIEVLFKQYRMDLNPGRYDTEVRNDDTINRNQILFNFL